jgi:3-oxoacyl-[acyl-carrier protein] reductase
MTDLTGKVALVTGASRGLGAAIAQRYARLGASVVVNYASNETAARHVVEAIEAAGGRALAMQADMSALVDIDRLFADVVDVFGHLDIVVANAGIEKILQSTDAVTEADYDRLYGINAKGTFFTLQRGARHLADGGRLIHIGSSSTVVPHPGFSLYTSSKVAAESVVRILAMEVGERGITVNSILPTATIGAGVFTALAEHDEHDVAGQLVRPLGGRTGHPEDTADAAEYLAGPLSAWVSGQALVVAGGAIQ